MNFRISMLAIIAFWHIGNIAGNEPAWQKELPCDPNTGCYPCAVAADSLNNKLIICGIRMQSFAGDGDFMLWEMGSGSNISQETKIGDVSEELALPLSMFNSIAIKTDKITVLGSKSTSPLSLLTINRRDDHESVNVTATLPSKYGNILITKLQSLDNSILLAGKEGTNGLLILLDENGNENWSELFDLGETEVFTDFVIGGDNEIYVTGFTAQIHAQNKIGFGNEAQNFLLLYDTDGRLLKQDYFDGVCSTKPPQITRLGNKNILVAYDKNIMATELNIRAYNPDFELLWETQVVKVEGNGPPGYFKIIPVADNKFFVGAVFNGGELVILECSSEGKVIERWDLGKIVGPYGQLHLATLDGKVYTVFSTRSLGKLKNIKTIITAFMIK